MPEDKIVYKRDGDDIADPATPKKEIVKRDQRQKRASEKKKKAARKQAMKRRAQEDAKQKAEDSPKKKAEEASVSNKKVADVPVPKKKPIKKPVQKKEIPKQEELPPNAIPMQSTPKHRAAIRRRKFMRFAKRIAVLALAVVLVFVVVSGYYKNMIVAIGDFGEGVGISLRGGEEFPLEYSLSSYNASKEMSGAFALLDSADLYVVSSSGSELLRLRHGFVNPGVSAGDSRALLYSIGGKDYSILGRTKTIYSGATEDEILFAQMSSGGSFALFSSNRTQSRMSVYNPTNNEAPQLVWTPTGVMPVRAAFHSDDKTLAVGCVYPEGGTLNTALYLINTGGSGSGTKEPIIKVAGMMPLQIHFLSGTRILVVYSSGYAAVYDAKGEELYRYDYGNQNLASAECKYGKVVLAFGGEEGFNLVMLSNTLELLGTQRIAGEDTVKFAISSTHIYVLAGQRVLGYTHEAALVSETLMGNICYGIVHSGDILVFTSAGVEKLGKPENIAESLEENYTSS